MARQVRRISELPEATELTGDELIEIVQDGENHRVTVDQLSGGSAPVQSVQGRTGDVVITAEDVGLGNVDDTSDADKPVSTAQQAALDGKVDKVAGMGLSSNDFTDPLRDKLIGIEAGATANSTDAYLLDRSNHTGTQAISTVSGLDAALAGKVDSDDARLSDSREWTATTVSQAEAEAGTSTTRRAWTAQRVRQAIAAWWDSTASAVGKTVATGTPAQGRTALGLGTAATQDVTTGARDYTLGRVVKIGDGGLFAPSLPVSLESFNTRPRISIIEANTIASIEGKPSGDSPGFSRRFYFNEHYGYEEWIDRTSGQHYSRSLSAGTFSSWKETLTTDNTTVDSNGFIKSASPIIKLHSDRIQTEADGTFERLGTGHYRITGCNGLRLTDGWYIETPHDKNGNKYFNVEWEQDVEPAADKGVLDEPADVTLTIRCYERVWNATTGQFGNGAPVDIPDGRWIDLRMNEVRVEEPEMPDEPEQPVPSPEPADPIIPNVVTMAQAKLALLYAGLFEAAEQYINELPEPQKTAALIEWNHRQTLEREHPLVGQVADGLGLTEQQLDELFLDASLR